MITNAEDAQAAYKLFNGMTTPELLLARFAYGADTQQATRPESIVFGGGRSALIAHVLKTRGVPDITPPDTQPMTEPTGDDAAALAVIFNAGDDQAQVAAIRLYWGDGDRADRTPREFLYLHLGMLIGLVDRLLARRVH